MQHLLQSLRATPLRTTACAVLIGLLLSGAPARAGEFSVSPIRLELDARVKSGAITLRNEDKARLSFQMQAVEWTQDADGKDQYTETRDLIFFPRILSIEPGEKGLVRVGVKAAVVPSEKTYRLFLEQLPPPPAEAGTGSGARLNVLMRFGAPIFVAPLKAQDSAEFTRLELARGALALAVKNTGNRHQMVQGIKLRGDDAQGKEVFALTLADRYLLAGTSKAYSAAIPAEACARMAALTVDLKTDKLTLSQKLDIAHGMCP
jgi:fimbrial chaperone protein